MVKYKYDQIFIETPSKEFLENSYETIIGKFSNLDSITLVHCWLGGLNWGTGGYWRKINVTYIVCGTINKSLRFMRYKSLNIHSPALNKWLTSKHKIEINNEKVIIPKEESIAKIKKGDFTIDMKFWYGYKTDNIEANFFRNVIITIESRRETLVSEFYYFVQVINKMVLFLTNKNPEAENYYLSDSDGNKFKLIKTKNNLKEDRFSQSINFRYFEIKDEFENFLNNWITNSKLDSIYDLILELDYNTLLSFPKYFLNQCVAIEAFYNFQVKTKTKQTNN